MNSIRQQPEGNNIQNPILAQIPDIRRLPTWRTTKTAKPEKTNDIKVKNEAPHEEENSAQPPLIQVQIPSSLVTLQWILSMSSVPFYQVFREELIVRCQSLHPAAEFVLRYERSTELDFAKEDHPLHLLCMGTNGQPGDRAIAEVVKRYGILVTMRPSTTTDADIAAANAYVWKAYCEKRVVLARDAPTLQVIFGLGACVDLRVRFEDPPGK
ncbi:hypothetical protein V8F20_002321 [Naviculisporaceae sp. PSN 640]